jgi:flagellar hook-basal body complex protein FliE
MIESIRGIGGLNFAKSLDQVGSVGTGMETMSAQKSVANQGSFTSVLTGITTSMVDDLKGAETASINGLNGKANTREVVDAVMAAEQSLQTAIAFRDKIVSAYLDISKMQI